MNIWFTLLYQPLINILILFYRILGQNLGLAIIALTLAIRGALFPITRPSLQSAEKMRELAPELEKLKKKYKKDKQAFAQAQLKLYQKHGINPAAGCLPQIIQIIILIALFQAFNQVLRADGEIINKLNQVLYSSLQFAKTETINTSFLYLDLTKPDYIQLPFKINLLNFSIDKFPGIFLLLAAVTQFLSSKMMMPSVQAAQVKAKKTPEQEDDMAAMMQKQMLYMMPLMTLFIGFKFPSGLVLYWFTFSLFMIIQQKLLKNKKTSAKG